jgi:hypothetical protein
MKLRSVMFLLGGKECGLWCRFCASEELRVVMPKGLTIFAVSFLKVSCSLTVFFYNRGK